MTSFGFFVSAALAHSTLDLTVTKSGAGSGTIISTNVGGINCGTDCHEFYDFGGSGSNTVGVALQATPSIGSYLASGPDEAYSDGTHPITTANFRFEIRRLGIGIGGNGSGTIVSSPAGINCGAGNTDCEEVYNSATTVTLTASAGANSYFVDWTGCESKSGNICTVTMSYARNVDAVFAQLSLGPFVWGKTTESVPWSGRAWHTALAWGDTLYILGGGGLSDGSYLNDTWLSQDGVDWVQQPTSASCTCSTYLIGGVCQGTQYCAENKWTPRSGHSSVIAKIKTPADPVAYEGMWVIGGYDETSSSKWVCDDLRTELWSSSSGGQLQLTSVCYRSHYEGVYKHSYKNDVWASYDGAKWYLVAESSEIQEIGYHPYYPAWERRWGHTSVFFKDKLWVMGGEAYSKTESYRDWNGQYVTYETGVAKNDVWSSSDGAYWTAATYNAPWSSRYGHSSVVFDNKIWVIGGWSGNGYKNDVWYSSDGVNWTQATANAAWSARGYHSSVVFQNKMWVLGGNANGQDKNDAWYSIDGINWTEWSGGPGQRWSPREGQAAAVFAPSLRTENSYFNEINKRWVGLEWSGDFGIWVLGGYSNVYNQATGGYNRAYEADVWRTQKPKLTVERIRTGTGALSSSPTGLNCYFQPRDKAYPNESSLLGQECSASFDYETDVTLTALPDADTNTRLVSWFGCDSTSLTPSGTVCHLNMDSNRNISVQLSPAPYVVLGDLKEEVADVIGSYSQNTYKAVVYRKALWVAGGSDDFGGTQNNWVIRSVNGRNWSKVGNLPAGPLAGFGFVVFKDKMWVLGGYENVSLSPIGFEPLAKNNAWWSTDGATWHQVSNIPWSPRYGFTTIVSQGRLWVIGGNLGGQDSFSKCSSLDALIQGPCWGLLGDVTDVWSSADGINWVQETVVPELSAADEGSCIANKCIFGGQIRDISGGGYTRTVDTGPSGTYKENIHRANYGLAIFDNKAWVIAGWGCPHPQDYNYVSSCKNVLSRAIEPIYYAYVGRAGTGDGRISDPLVDYTGKSAINCPPTTYQISQGDKADCIQDSTATYPDALFGHIGSLGLGAQANSGSVANNWLGCDSITPASLTTNPTGIGRCEVGFNHFSAATAVFTSTYPLDVTVYKFGQGSGKVTSSDTSSPINCPITCSKDYNKNAVVTLTATPASDGSQFLGWGGVCASSKTSLTCSVTMDQAKDASAVFSLFPATCSRSVMVLTSPVLSGCVVEKSVLAEFSASPLPTCTLTVSPPNFKAGDTVTITWTATNDPDSADIEGVGSAASGSMEINAPGSTIKMTVKNKAGQGICTAAAQQETPPPGKGKFDLKRWREILPF